MSFLNGVRSKLSGLLEGIVPKDKIDEVLDLIQKKKEEELKKAPRIAIIGKTGVGKSSTINSLFGTNLSFSHTEACTQEATEIVLTNEKGEIIVLDMPGLGEDIERDKVHRKTYRKELPDCDIVLWILNIDDREMSYQQTQLKQIQKYCSSRLVICANKADKMHPNDWLDDCNLPSEQQVENLEKRITDIREKLSKIVPILSEDRIVYYSATKRYRLDELFRAMMDACPDHRAWVLDDRKNLADFRELMHEDILKQYNSK